MIRGLALALLLAVPAAAGAQRHRLPPVDQCGSDPGFASFRAALLGAIERRDAAFILSILADDVMVDFGGGQGRDAFARSWRLDRPADSALWRELGAALRLGCARLPASDDEPETFWSPSLFVELGDEDGYTTYIAVGPNAVLRSRPSDAGPVVARLYWDVLTTATIDGESPWPRVSLADGRSGYVRRDAIRSAIDFRAGFAREDGRWRIKYFIAGD